MREVVLDTETTGLDSARGHRIIEVGCVELENHVPTGVTFQRYVNPGIAIERDAQAVHGRSNEDLADEPPFAAIVDDLLVFLADSPLVIHNAEFDLGFLNAELARLDRPPLPAERAIDTVLLARRRFPGAPANLNALCKRFAIDLSERALHGALLDARLLAAVYVELLGDRQAGLDLTARKANAAAIQRAFRVPRPHAPSAAELAAHEAFLAKLGDPIWRC
ncbi:MAG: DNA polymerase III subunit epsilon [Alphaproteobacteria bacterium]|nr:DNA polymerase III subunit epsilon [Alphaproteobacteria bacterium]